MMNEYFKSQIDQGATEMFFYAIEREGNLTIQRHRGTLDSFPTNLEYVRHLTDGVPLFKEKE
jgi:hypothetical protein